MTIWKPAPFSGGKPRYLALADALETDIASGELAPGQRLPTHRDLADALGVTVGTITRGYAEAARRGLVRGEVGRGTVVASDMEGSTLWWGLDTGHGAELKSLVDMGLVSGLSGQDPDLATALAELATRGGVQELLRYQPARGLLRHREAGCLWLAQHGVAVGPEQVSLTCGGQHALLVLFSGLFRQGDRVLAASLNYPGLMSVATLLGLKLVPLESDGEGILPEAVEEACAREKARGLYLMPGMHNPTTARMGQVRREKLAELARRHELLLVEDGAYALNGPDTPDAPCEPLCALVPERGFYIASTSKALSEGLRVAYISSPLEFVERLGQGITGTTWMAAPLCAELATHWLGNGTADAVLARKRAEAMRRNLLAAKLLAGTALAQRPMGFFAWLPLPEPWRGEDFERAALERGVAVVAAGAFAVGQSAAPMAVRLSFSAPRTQADLERGLVILAELLREPPRQGRAIV